jgi:2-iminobutanoate/2-iminopropanoate deaminase
MAGGVDLRMGADVAEIVRSASGVRVRSSDGTSEEGSHVVVTVPLGVLKRDVLRFSPALPPGRRAAIERLGSVRYEKVALRFDEPFWRAAGLPNLMIFPRDPDAPVVCAIGQDASGARPVLVFHIFHSATGRVLDAIADDAARWVLDMLAEATGSSCPAPAARSAWIYLVRSRRTAPWLIQGCLFTPMRGALMTTEAISTDAAPAALGPYSQAIVAGGLVFYSGTAGIDPATGVPGDGIEAQTELALGNLDAILTAAGTSLSALVKTTIFYTNVEDFATIDAIYARFMSDPSPARSAPANVMLPRGLLISIDAVAVLPSPYRGCLA